MPADETVHRFETRKKAYQFAYDNFHYTDAQRERVIEFTVAAMAATRGELPFEALQNVLPIRRSRATSIDSQANRGGMRYTFDARFMNEWTSIYLLGTAEAGDGKKVEPYHLQIDFSPPMEIDRGRLQDLLRLKVAPGWTPDGGNLAPPAPSLHELPPFDGGYFRYSVVNPPNGDFLIEVELTYLNGPDKNPYTARLLSHLEIRRRYLEPEEIKQRDTKRFGHLPHTGDRCTVAGRYVPVFANDEHTRMARAVGKSGSYAARTVFCSVALRNLHTGKEEQVPAWWQWVGPDPFAEEIARLFGDKPFA